MTAKELIEKLETLDPDTVIVTWREYNINNGFYEIKLGDVKQAIKYTHEGSNTQYLPSEKGSVKMVSVF